MTFDMLMTRAAVDELQNLIVPSRIDKILQSSQFGIALTVRARRENRTLLLSADPTGARVTLTGKRLAKAFAHAGPFIMLLRKYLESATMTAIEQQGDDRIVRITCAGNGGLYLLVVEIMGKHSNIILLDAKDTILGAIKATGPTMSRYRTVLPHHPYVSPPPPHRAGTSLPKIPGALLRESDTAAIIADASSARDLATGLVETVAGISPQLAREVIYRAAEGNPMTAGRLYDEIQRMMMGPPERPSIVFTHDVPGEARILGWASYTLRQHGETPQIYDSIAETLDMVYGERESSDPLLADRRVVQQAIDRQRARLLAKGEALERQTPALHDVARLREIGELLLAYAHSIPEGRTAFTFPGESEPVQLDPTIDAVANAQEYFRRYKKARQAGEKLPALVQKTMNDLAYLDQAQVLVDQADTSTLLRQLVAEIMQTGFPLLGAAAGTRDRRAAKEASGGQKFGRKESPRPPGRRFVSEEGLEIRVGRSARENEEVTFRSSARGDLWLHARHRPGSHVVLKTAGQTPGETSIIEAAELAAFYSSARADTRVEVDVVPLRNVSRIKGGHPGTVRISGERTVLVQPRAPDDAS